MFALSAAVGALACASSALAQDAATYEYAQPAGDAPVVFRSEPVVQPLAAPETPADAVTYTVEAVDAPAPPAPPMPPMPPVPPLPPLPAYAEPAYAPRPPGAYMGPQAYSAAYPHHGYAAPVRFDRAAWLADCHGRIRGVDRADRARVIGGLLGAVAGGVIGNRVWDTHRLAGTLAGAGLGGVAGVAVGSAVASGRARNRDDECALYLDRYVSGGGFAGGYPGYGYDGFAYPGYGYGYGYTLVPVLVMVPQRAVVRETVTEEWVDEPVRRRTIRPAAHPDKRIRYTK